MIYDRKNSAIHKMKVSRKGSLELQEYSQQMGFWKPYSWSIFCSWINTSLAPQALPVTPHSGPNSIKHWLLHIL